MRCAFWAFERFTGVKWNALQYNHSTTRRLRQLNGRIMWEAQLWKSQRKKKGEIAQTGKQQLVVVVVVRSLLLIVTFCYSSILALWAASYRPLRSNRWLHLQFPIWQTGREGGHSNSWMSSSCWWLNKNIAPPQWTQQQQQVKSRKKEKYWKKRVSLI